MYDSKIRASLDFKWPDNTVHTIGLGSFYNFPIFKEYFSIIKESVCSSTDRVDSGTKASKTIFMFSGLQRNLLLTRVQIQGKTNQPIKTTGGKYEGKKKTL